MICAALYGGSLPTTQALTAKTVEKNCNDLTVCYKGANKAVPCTIATTDCPPCVTFNDGGCYEKKSDDTCSFGSLCSTYWEADPSTSTGSGSGSVTPAAASSKSASGAAGAAGAATAGTNSTGTNATASSHASAAGAGTAGSSASASDSKGSDMSVVFAIIGAAMGVIAVAVIFLTLVRRSRAAHEDDDDVATPPAAMSKEPVSTTAAVTYASYDHDRGMSGGAPLATAVEPSVASYYAQQPKDLPIASPRVAGRAVPAATATTSSVASYYAQQPQNMPATSPRVGRAVPASAPRPAPVPTLAARAMPMFANKAPLSNPQQYQQQQEVAYHQAPPAVQVQEAPRRVSSPRNRRESFEF